MNPAGFPPFPLAIRPPYPPMEARTAAAIPRGDHWLYEPKWDGFRCLVFRADGAVALQSKSGQPLTRYFPELVEAAAALRQRRFVLDGEIVVAHEGHLDFDALLQRIHPAASRVRRLAAETPCSFLAFDLLLDGAKDSDVAATARAPRRARAVLHAGSRRLPPARIARHSRSRPRRAMAA